MDKSIGSVWGKWDFHIHTPYSILNNNFGFNPFDQHDNYHEKEFDRFVVKLFTKAVKENIVAIGITDYFIIDGYKRIKEQYLQNPEKLRQCFPDEELRNKVQEIFVFPNIELRIDTFVGNHAHSVNYHVIFSDEIPIQDIEENFIQKLSFVNSPGENLSLSKHNIINFGNDLKHDNGIEGDPLYVGLKHVTVNSEKILEVLRTTVFQGKHIIAIPVDEDLSSISWNGRDYTTRKNLYKQCHCYLTSNEKTRKWALASGEESIRISEFGSIKPCIWGSDAHSFEEMFSPSKERFCWIKALPTFEGLLQILYEPSERVRIQKERPNLKSEHHLIKSIVFTSPEFPTKPILFNESLSCIIGGKSTGKSMLLRHLAYSIDKDYASNQERIIRVGKQSSFVPQPATVYWQDGTNESKEFVYIPQTFLNRTIDDPEKETTIDSFIKEVLLQNERIKEAYNELQANCKLIKGEIRTHLILYKEQLDSLKKIEAEIKQEGGSKSFDSTLNKLKKERNDIAHEVLVTEETISKYTMLKEKVQNLRNQLQTCLDNIEFVDLLPEPKATFDDRELFYSNESPLENCPLAKSNPNIFENMRKFIQRMNSYLSNQWKEEKTKIIEKTNQQKTDTEKEISDIIPEYKELKTKVEQNEQLQKLAEKISIEEEKLKRAKKREDEKEEIISSIINIKSKIRKAHKRYSEVYSDYCTIINQIGDYEGTDLRFSAQTTWKKESFIQLIETAFDKRFFISFNSKYKQTIEQPSEEKFNNELLFDIWEALTNNENYGELKLKGGNTLESILPRLFDDWYNVHYVVTSGNDDNINQMSPGKKALVLLELLINLKETQSPILIDQPEDDLDNRSIYQELAKFIKEKKIKRQIIVVTHNANIVLGADAEQVIIANQNGKDTPNNDDLRFEYRSGALEDNEKEQNSDGSERTGILSRKGIQTQICDILEGGRTAFELRRNKYSVNLNSR